MIYTRQHRRHRPAKAILAALAVLGGITALVGRPGSAGATSSTTVSMVDDINGLYGGGGSSNPSDLTAVGSSVFFFANDGVNGIQLWSSDGTPSGTTRLSSAGDITTPGFSSSPQDMIAVGNEAYFLGAQTQNGSSDCGLWKSDGTVSGTQEVTNAGTICSAAYMVAFGGHLYFEINQSGAGGGQIWTSDGTAAGTVAATSSGCDIGGLYFYTGLFVDGSEMYFGASDGCSSGDQLWKSDGTAAGTVPVSNIATDLGGLDPQNFGAVGNEIYFAGTDGSSTGTPPGHDRQLWKSDGSTVTMVTSAAVGNGGWQPAVLTTVGTNLYFQVSDPTAGFQIWKDDTLNSDALTQVTNIDQNTAQLQSDMVSFGNALYFSVTSSDLTVQGLWSYDGTTLTQLTSEQNWSLTPAGSLLFFVGNDSTSSYQIWQSDGTATGTVQDSSINPSYPYGGSSAQFLTAVGSVLFFSANDGINGQELWKADPGGSGGTTDTTPPSIGYQESPNGSAGWFTTAPATVTVTASDSASGVQSLSCTTDGSPSSTTPNGTDSFFVSTSAEGAHTVDCIATDNAGNSSETSTALDLDTTSPVVTYGTSCPPASAVYLNASVSANWTASDPTPGSGLVSTASGSQALNTSAVGLASVTAPQAMDVAGNTSSGPTCNYVVQYVLNVSSPADGSTYKHKTAVPITATLTDINGTRISDTLAKSLASACMVKASGGGAQTLASTCLSYSTKTHSFSGKWRLGGTTGAASVTVTVDYSGTSTTTTVTNNFTIS